MNLDLLGSLLDVQFFKVLIDCSRIAKFACSYVGKLMATLLVRFREINLELVVV